MSAGRIAEATVSSLTMEIEMEKDGTTGDYTDEQKPNPATSVHASTASYAFPVTALASFFEVTSAVRD